jgi:hypothetical protein
MQLPEDIQTVAVSGCKCVVSACHTVTDTTADTLIRLQYEGHCLCSVRLQQNAAQVQRYAAAEGSTGGSVVPSALSG